MEKIPRRTFARDILGSLLTLSLVRSLCSSNVVANPLKTVVRTWVIRMEEVTKALRSGKLQPREWQTEIESLLSHVDLEDLLQVIDYDRLAKSAMLPTNHESVEDVSFRRTEGLPEELSFAPYFYALRKDVAIVPHGHRNMTSMHMILKGQAHAWHFERVSDDSRFLLIKPTADKVASVGEASTISDQRDNIHWFKALTEPVFMFNIGVFGIDPNAAFTGREYIDPLGGEKLPGGLIRAPRLDAKEAYKRYGRT